MADKPLLLFKIKDRYKIYTLIRRNFDSSLVDDIMYYYIKNNRYERRITIADKGSFLIQLFDWTLTKQGYYFWYSLSQSLNGHPIRTHKQLSDL